jgi:hypothetical protein
MMYSDIRICSQYLIPKKRSLLSKGLDQSDIAKELNTTRQTIIRDMKVINTCTNDNLNDLVRATLSTIYYSCIMGLNEIIKECRRIYKIKDINNNGHNRHNLNNNSKHLSWWHKIAVLKSATEINFKKFDIPANGLAILKLKKLEDRVTALRNGIISESEFKVSNQST